jgi:starch phosphorylase
MVREYTERFYLPATQHVRRLTADSMARARALAAWRTRVQAAWPRVAVEAVQADLQRELEVGDSVRTRARVQLAGLTPDDVTVELYVGRVNPDGELAEAEPVPMHLVGPDRGGSYTFEAVAPLARRSGLGGFTVRVRPAHQDLVTRFVPGLITWARVEAAQSALGAVS